MRYAIRILRERLAECQCRYARQEQMSVLTLQKKEGAEHHCGESQAVHPEDLTSRCDLI